MKRLLAIYVLLFPVFALCSRERPGPHPGPASGTGSPKPAPAMGGPGPMGGPMGEVSPASKNITGKATEKLIGTVKTMGKCTIRVERLVKIDHFRGPGPFSQSLRDQLKSNPRLARSYRGRSHGDRHLRCTYAITINDRHYTYAHHISNTLRQHTDARCSQKIDELLVHLFSVTDNCKDLNHGAYYGFHIKTGVR